MMTKKERGLSEPTFQAFLSKAQQYHFGATTLFSAACRAESPLYFLYTQTIELALKALLRSRGLSIPRTHALRSLCRQCQDTTWKVMSQISDALKNFSFEINGL